MDIQTCVFILCLTTAINAIVVLYMQRRTGVAGAMEWGVGTGILSFGLLLLGMRGSIGSLGGIVVANSCILSGYAIVWNGMRRFVGREPTWLVFAVSVLALTVFVGGLGYFTYTEPSVVRRMQLSAFFICFFSVVIANTLLSEKLHRRSVTFTGTMYCLNAIVSSFRIVEPALDSGMTVFFQSGFITSLFFDFSILFSIGVAGGQVFMIKGENGCLDDQGTHS